MHQIIGVNGASSGFGAMSARAGHTAYAGIRDTAGRNAPAVGDRVRTEFYRRIGLDDLLHVRA